MEPFITHSLPHKDAITSLTFHPSPTLLSRRKSNHSLSQVASGTSDGGLTIWNFNQGRTNHTTRSIGGGDSDGDGNNYDGTRTSRKNNGRDDQHNNIRAFKFCGHTGAIHDIAYSPSGSLLASASADKTVRLWVPKANGDSVVLRGHTAPVRGVDFSPHVHHHSCSDIEASASSSSSLLMTCSDDKLVKLWSLPSKSFHCSLKGHTNWVRTCKFSPDVTQSHIAASGGDDGTIKVWDIVKGINAVTYTMNPNQSRRDGTVDGAVMDISFHPSGSILAASLADGWVKLYDLRTDELIHTYPPIPPSNSSSRPTSSSSYGHHGEDVVAHCTYGGGTLSFRPNSDGNHLMTSQCTYSQHQSQSFHLWDIRSHGKIFTVSNRNQQEHQEGNYAVSNGNSSNSTCTNSSACCAFSNDGMIFATGGSDKIVQIWDTDDASKLESSTTTTIRRRRRSTNTNKGNHKVNKIVHHNTSAHTNAEKKSSRTSTSQIQRTTESGMVSEYDHSHTDEVTNPNTLANNMILGQDGECHVDERIEVNNGPTTSVLMEGTLNRVIGQIELLTKTMALIEKRLSIQEECMKEFSSNGLPKKSRDS